VTPFIRPRPVDDPAVRVVVFHHAGGSAVMYYPLLKGLPADWDLLLLDLPGRGRRHRSPALTDMPSLVDVATCDILPWADAPLALFGHSLGAIVAAEVGRRLEASGAPLVWVGVSSRPGPHSPVPHPLPLDAPDEELIEELAATGGVPERLDAVPGYRERFLRLVRDDLRAAASYRPDPARRRLVAPLTGFSGQYDHLAPPVTVDSWIRETDASFRHRSFPGGHFYFLDAAFEALAAAVTHEIRLSTGSGRRTPR
jgi:medium-chain acyl-[acyl-carrier-protein] hydrolase